MEQRGAAQRLEFFSESFFRLLQTKKPRRKMTVVRPGVLIKMIARFVRTSRFFTTLLVGKMYTTIRHNNRLHAVKHTKNPNRFLKTAHFTTATQTPGVDWRGRKA